MKIKCIDKTFNSHITVGKIYEVIGGTNKYNIVNDIKETNYYDKELFEIVSENKKYEVIKEFYSLRGIIYCIGERVFQNDSIDINLLLNKGYIKEIKEEEKPKPKYKVGDYVVTGCEYKKYIKIDNVYFNGIKECFFYSGYKEENLRLPTKEELELYFR